MMNLTTATAPTANDLSHYVSLPEAARLADIDQTWMRQLVVDGKIPGRKIGRNYVVDARAAAAYVRHPSRGRPRTKGRPAGRRKTSATKTKR